MSSAVPDQTYYEILEVSSQAPHHEIVRAYHRSKATYSVDSPALYSMFTKEEAEALRQLIEEAFQILGNEAKRREYDEKMNAHKKETEVLDYPPVAAPNPDVTQLRTPENDGNKKMDFDKNAPLPDGYKKTRLSIYEVKPDVENEIKNCADVDGAFLRKIRLYKNINLDQMAKETRISRTYINAVESNDFETLPAAVFVRGFTIQISRLLGLDENLVSNTYMAKFKKDE